MTKPRIYKCKAHSLKWCLDVGRYTLTYKTWNDAITMCCLYYKLGSIQKFLKEN